MPAGRQGFSLLEVIIFTTILSLFFVSAATVTTFYLRNIKFNERKILATRYAEELNAWLKGEKEDDWITFVTTRTAVDDPISKVVESKIWCFNSTEVVWPTAEGACTDYGLVNNIESNTVFKREAVLTNQDSSNVRVNAKITVSWLEGTTIQRVTINSIFGIPE